MHYIFGSVIDVLGVFKTFWDTSVRDSYFDGYHSSSQKAITSRTAHKHKPRKYHELENKLFLNRNICPPSCICNFIYAKF